jgi:LysR family cys regulon transcriptional activator
MTLQQLRYLCGVVDHGYSVSNAARVLFTSQPGISKQIQALEQELGIEILLRQGNRITGTTPAGAEVVEMARRMLQCAENIRRIGGDHAALDKLRLVVATTHVHARYVLRAVISRYVRDHPEVELVLRQGSPAQIEQWVASGEADLGVGGNTPDPMRELVFLPCGELQRSALTPRDHKLQRARKITFEMLAEYPLITLDSNLSGGSAVSNGFAEAGIAPMIVLTATDADVIKSYVGLGLGIAVLPTIVYEPERDSELAAVDVSHLFKPTVTQVQLRRGSYLQSHLVDFISMAYPAWTKPRIVDAVGS